MGSAWVRVKHHIGIIGTKKAYKHGLRVVADFLFVDSFVDSLKFCVLLAGGEE